MNKLPDDATGDALREYIRLGSDLTRKMKIDFFVFAPSHKSALEIQEKVDKLGFISEIEFDEETQEWTCCCSKTIIPSYDKVSSIEEELSNLAEPFGGCYDGFGSFGNAET